jgi:hypothetical protein
MKSSLGQPQSADHIASTYQPKYNFASVRTKLGKFDGAGSNKQYVTNGLFFHEQALIASEGSPSGADRNLKTFLI